MFGICSFCGTEIEIIDKVARADICDSCKHDLRCCVQCIFFEKAAYNKCKEPQAERVIDKEHANFCEYFKFSSRKPEKNAKQEVLTKLDALFKK